MSSRSIFLRAEWRKLIMVQYQVDPAVLQPWLPAGVELDLFHGACFVSVIGFLFDKVRIKGLPIPFHTRFEEINLRFYVRRIEPGAPPRRGVVFIRELVPRFAISLVANTLYEEPYATVPTRRHIRHTPEALSVRYTWRFKRHWHSLRVEADPAARPMAPGSIEEFITEHYWGFTRRSSGATSQYQVEHPRWLTYPVRSWQVQADFAALYGPAFAHLDRQEPHSVLLAEGAPVNIYNGSTL